MYTKQGVILNVYKTRGYTKCIIYKTKQSIKKIPRLKVLEKVYAS